MGFSSAEIPSPLVFASFETKYGDADGEAQSEKLAQQSYPSAIDPSFVAQQPKAKPAASLLTPKRLIYTHGAEAICDRLPALQHQRRGVALFDEGEVATMMMARPVMKATHIFDLIQEPGYEHTVQNLGELLKHFTSAFVSWW